MNTNPVPTQEPESKQEEKRDIEFRLRPRATLAGFFYDVECRASNPPKGKISLWEKVGGPFPKDYAEASIETLKGNIVKAEVAAKAKGTNG